MHHFLKNLTSSLRIMTLIRELTSQYPWMISINVVLIILVNLSDVASMLILIPMIDLIIDPELQNVSVVTHKIAHILREIDVTINFKIMAIIFLIFHFIKTALNILAANIMVQIKYAVQSDIILNTFGNMFNAQWTFFKSEQQGKLLNAFWRETCLIADSIGYMSLIVSTIMQIFCLSVIPFLLSWKITLICIGIAIFLLIPFQIISPITHHLATLNSKTASLLFVKFQESISAAKIILGFGKQKEMIRQLSLKYNEHRQVAVKCQTLQYSISLLYYPLGLTAVIATIFVARKLMMPIAELTVIVYSLMRVVNTFGGLINNKNMLDSCLPSFEQIKLINERAKIKEQRHGIKLFNDINNTIILDNVSFSYDDNVTILSNISMEIRQGKMVAILGSSGSGKSTLIDLIMGLQEPTIGIITIDGIPLLTFDMTTYRQRIGYVPQEVILFNGTIRDNLLWACESASDTDIQTVCQLAHAHEFIMEFPNGYETMVGDRGVRLSGGQAQRIALARAIIRKPALLILDEATSALDTQSERYIQEAIEQIAKDTTIIVIAHRLSTITKADYIYVFDHGRIIESGRYRELLAAKGKFHQMIQQQQLQGSISENI